MKRSLLAISKLLLILRQSCYLSILCIAYSACTPGSSSSGTTTTTPAVPVNATETAIAATWYLKKKADTGKNSSGAIDTASTKSYIGYTNAWYINFELTANAPYNTSLSTNECMNVQDQVLHIALNIGSWQQVTSPTIMNTYWYYNETSQMLVFNSMNYYVISVTATDLVLRLGNPSINSSWMTYYFKK